MSGYELERLFDNGKELNAVAIFQLIQTVDGVRRAPINELGKKQKNKAACIRLIKLLEAIKKRGVARSIEIKTMKHLEGKLYEIRDVASTMRLYCYNEQGIEIVVIVGIEAETHKGGSSQSQRYIDKYQPKIGIVERLLQEGGHDDCYTR